MGEFHTLEVDCNLLVLFKAACGSHNRYKHHRAVEPFYGSALAVGEEHHEAVGAVKAHAHVVFRHAVEHFLNLCAGKLELFGQFDVELEAVHTKILVQIKLDGHHICIVVVERERLYVNFVFSLHSGEHPEEHGQREGKPQ